MDDEETLHRRARLRELIDVCFDGKDVLLLDFIEARIGKRPNQGELSAIQKDHGSKSFGDKKAKALTEQIGLVRHWFTMPVGANTSQEHWMSEIPTEYSRSPNKYIAKPEYAKPLLVNLSEHPDLCPVRRVNFKLAAGVHGYGIELDNGDKAPVFFRKDWMQANGYKPERLVAFRVAGESMQTSLWDGDLVVINLDDAQPHDGEVFAVSYKGEPGIKRLRRDAGEWWLTSDNSDQRRFAPKRCTDDVDILGPVIYKQSERI